MTDKKTLVLVDGSSYLYRAFHAMPDLRAVPGDPTSPATGAIRGMINMMQALRKEVTADYAVCVFDASGPTFRDALYTEYKATRSPMPDDLRSQIEPIHQVVDLLGWKVVAVPGVEADDVIATLAHTAAAQGIEVIVSSGDKDLSQLVNEHMQNAIDELPSGRDVAGVTAEFGVPPALMVDYQALVGDTVDNVPGVTKVGPKTAAKWLEEYGSLDNLIANADAIKGVAGNNLREAIASGQLALSRQLVTMKTDCALADYIPGLPAFDDITLDAPDNEGLLPFYEKYGFKGLAAAIKGAAAPAAAAPTVAMPGQSGDLFADHSASPVAEEAQHRTVVYDTILNWADFDQWLERLHKAPLTAIDTETDSLDEMRAQIVGISFSVQPGEAAYIPLRHEGPDAPAHFHRAAVGGHGSGDDAEQGRLARPIGAQKGHGIPGIDVERNVVEGPEHITLFTTQGQLANRIVQQVAPLPLQHVGFGQVAHPDGGQTGLAQDRIRILAHIRSAKWPSRRMKICSPTSRVSTATTAAVPKASGSGGRPSRIARRPASMHPASGLRM